MSCFSTPGHWLRWRFGRRGARPLNADDQRRLYVRNGKVYTVTNEPPQPAGALTLLEILQQEIRRSFVDENTWLKVGSVRL